MRRHFLDLGMVVSSNQDRIDITRQHTRGVGHTLAAPQLHLSGGHEHAVAAKLLHRHFERSARAGRILLEYHAKRMPGQRRVGIGLALRPTGPCRLAVHRIGKHRRYRIPPCVAEI